MKQKMKRLVAAGLTALLTLSLAAIPTFAQNVGAKASTTIAINKTNFPNAKFRAYISANFDTNEDGKLSKKERYAVTEMAADYLEAGSLKGIAYFPNLESLTCRGNGLKTLDVSKNIKLKTLWCNDNKLKSLNVSKNTALLDLGCSDNQLTSLNLSKNTRLQSVDCSRNQLTSLNLSKNTKLTFLDCSTNQLQSVDVTKSAVLKTLRCYENRLTALNVTKNKKLEELSCFSNQIQTLNVTANPALTEFSCSNNQLKTLNVTKNTKLAILMCENNQLKNLNLSKNKVLLEVYCGGNQLGFLNFNNQGATNVGCDYNHYPLYSTSLAPLVKMGFDPQKASSWNGAEYDIQTQKLKNVTANRVTFTYSLGNGQSALFTLFVKKLPVPEKPEVGASGEYGRLSLKWNYDENVDYYRVYFYDGKKYTQVAQTTDSGYLASNVKLGKTYKVLVRAFNDGGASKYTAADCVTVTIKSEGSY